MLDAVIANEKQLVLAGRCPRCGGNMVDFGSEIGFDDILKGQVEEFTYECDFCKIWVTTVFFKGKFESFNIESSN